MSPARSDDPLRRVTLNLYEADCLWLEHRYGHGWTTNLRDIMHRHILDTIIDETPYVPNKNTVRMTLAQWTELNKGSLE